MYFKRLAELRIDADKTQKEIADVLSCKREVYRRYEKGIHEIPAWALITLAEYYCCSADYLLGLTDKKTPYPKAKTRALFHDEQTDGTKQNG